MAHISKGKGLTVSDSRTRRSSATEAPAPAENVTDEDDVATAEVVPDGTVADVVAWIGDDPARAEAVADDARKGVRDAAAKVLNA